MWLAIPSPSPSGINVTVTVPTDTALDNYTLALAIFTGLLALFTVGLAVIGWRALRLQGREIKATEEQLRLAREEFDAARRAARPELEVGIVMPTPSVTQVSTTYITGSEPAYDVSVWLRSATGYFAIGIGTVVAGSQPRTLMFPSGFSQLDEDAIANMWQFPAARRALEADNHIWAGIQWYAPDRTQGRHLRLFAGRGEAAK